MTFFSKLKSNSSNSTITRKANLHGILNAVYKFLLFLSSLSVIILILFILYILFDNSRLMIDTYGFSNIFQDKWYSSGHNFGFMPFIQGTLITSIYALIISLPLSIGISLYVSQYITNFRIKNALKFTIELIAAIPSVIIGLWGIVVLGPLLQDFIPFLDQLHFIPYFNEPVLSGLNLNVFTATIALVIMITPIIISVTISIMDQVPVLQKEAAFALGATPWEMSRMTIIPLSFRGIIGAVSLGFGRALGETMAVTMLIGNSPSVFNSIFDGGSSVTSVITNEWAEVITDPYARAALLELALILMVISIFINLFAKILVNRNYSTKQK